MGADAILFYFWHDAVIFAPGLPYLRKRQGSAYTKSEPDFPPCSGGEGRYSRIRKICPYFFEVFPGIDIESQAPVSYQ
jgi:hypothetical protein